MDIKRKKKEKTNPAARWSDWNLCGCSLSDLFLLCGKEGAEKRMVEVVNYVKVQCSTYTHYNESSESKVSSVRLKVPDR